MEGGFCLLNALHVLEMPEVIHNALLCMLEVVEGRLKVQRCRGYALFTGGAFQPEMCQRCTIASDIFNTSYILSRTTRSGAG